MFIKVFVVLLLLVIVFTLISSFWFLVRDKGEGTRTVRRLTWRVGLSMLLFVLLYVAFLLGWIKPGGGNPIHYPQPAVSGQETDE